MDDDSLGLQNRLTRTVCAIFVGGRGGFARVVAANAIVEFVHDMETPDNENDGTGMVECDS